MILNVLVVQLGSLHYCILYCIRVFVYDNKYFKKLGFFN